MAEHTPGPWVVEDVFSDYPHDICLGYDVPRAGSPILVAHVTFDEKHDGPIDARRATANARLIAAAPEILQELKEIGGILERVSLARLEGRRLTKENADAFMRRLNHTKELVRKATGTPVA